MNGNPLREERNLPGCRLCPRACGADRAAGEEGLCGAGKEIRIARAALHFWEEPCISGTKGSGAVFFSGCPLRCVYCQNREISRGLAGASVSVERLAEIFMELQEQQANNINLVTAGHYLPQVREALLLAKGRGLSVPVVYNTSSYEKPEALRMLEGLVDIYLPDLKYLDPDLAGNLYVSGEMCRCLRACGGRCGKRCHEQFIRKRKRQDRERMVWTKRYFRRNFRNS